MASTQDLATDVKPEEPDLTAHEPSPSLDTASDDPVRKELLQDFAEILQEDELRYYMKRKDRIHKAFQSCIPSLIASLDKPRQSLHRTEARAAKARRSSKRLRIPATLVVIFVLISLGLAILSLASDIQNREILLRLPRLSNTLERSQRIWSAASLMLALIIAGAGLPLLVRKYVELFSAEFQAASERNAYRRMRRDAVGKAVRQTINEVLQGSGILVLPTAAPALVELHTKNIVVSSTQEYIKSFILSNESSAIGISGPRGSGKSTLMRAIAEDESVAGCSMVISAPVKYNAVEFTRRLFFEAAQSILIKAGARPEDSQLSRVKRVQKTRMLGAVMALYLGMAIVAVDFFWNSYFPLRLRPLTILGLTIFLYGLLVGYYAFLSRISKNRRRESRPVVRLAHEAIRDLTWEIEQGQKTKNILKIAGDLFGFEDEDSLTLKRRSYTHPDLVADFRRMLNEFSTGRLAERFVILIDELDKLSSRDELINAVNGLKDLFHIPGVHFIVSVSNDALASFEQRGMPARDAFDSAFDTIVSAERLKLEESLKVISSRAAGFPVILGVFCHAWSGGLPRDLLRAARRCVEIQRPRKEALRVIEIIRSIVVADLTATLMGVVQNASLKQGEADTLVPLIEQVRGLEDETKSLDSVFSYVQGFSTQSEVLERAAAFSRTGVAILKYFTQILQGQSDWDNPNMAVRSTASAFASAIGMQGQFKGLRDVAIRAAIAQAAI
jgi:hypothetical protein